MQSGFISHSLGFAAMNDWITVTVAFCAPNVEDLSEVRLPPQSTVRDAIDAAGILKRRPEPGSLDTGIWGQRCGLEQRVVDGDRVEIYRPLTIDPKEGRRMRADLRRKGRTAKQ